MKQMEALAAAVNAEVASNYEAPEPDIEPSEDEGYKSERSRAKRWDTVKTSYIDHRTKDPNRKEVRRAAAASDSESDAPSRVSSVHATKKKRRWHVDCGHVIH